MLSQFDYKNDANEFVFYGIIPANKFDFEEFNVLASKCININLENFDLKVYNNEYHYGLYKGFTTTIEYEYSDINKVVNDPKLADELNCQVKLILLNLYIISNPIFVCLCDWPNDTDFFKNNYARSTYGLISEFEPYIMDCDKHGGRNSKEWIRIIKNVGELILLKYDGITW